MAATSRPTVVRNGGASATGDPGPEVARAVAALALAVQRHRIYPLSSPLCVQAIGACRSSLGQLRDGLALRVSPAGLQADAPLPATPMIRELSERLFRADVASVQVDPGVPAAELARFTRLLARWERRDDPELLLAERLIDEGVTAVRVRLTDRLELLELPPLSPEDGRAVATEREARGGRIDPVEDEGAIWVRVDGDLGLGSLDLADLAFLVDDPVELARVLQEARGDRTDGRGYGEILSGGLRELVDLYGTLSPDVAGARFRELGRVLTSLDEPTRRRLIDEILVPDLLETGRPAPLVSALPDAEIAGLLRRLGERRLGAPGLIEHALGRAGLSREREAAVREALDPADASDGEGGAAAAAAVDRRRLRLDAGGAGGATLLELAAKDLSVDPATEEALAAFHDESVPAAPAEEWLRCHVQLVQHVLNPEVAEGFLGRTTELLRERRAEGEGEAVAAWIERFRLAADGVRSRSPEVAGATDRALLGLCSVDFLRRAVREWEDPDADADSREIVAALGPLAGARLLEALESEPSRASRRRLMDFMCESARTLAPGLLPHLSDPRWTVVRNAASVLGFAGEGQETSLAALLEHAEPRVVREAFLALARIGSDEAARVVVERVASAEERVREMACESVRRFPRERGRRMARELLADPGFHRPWAGPARRMLDHFFAEDPSAIERSTLEALRRLRWHVWSPARMRLGWTAWSLSRGDGR